MEDTNLNPQQEMENTSPLGTGERAKTPAENFFELTQQSKFVLCSLCNLVAGNTMCPSYRNAAEELDEGFYAYYKRVMQDFTDTYRDLDASIPFLEKGLEAMNTFTTMNMNIEIPAGFLMEPFAFSLRQHTYRNHIRHCCCNLIKDIREIRTSLDSCFFIHHRIVEICQSDTSTMMSDSVQTRSRYMMDTIAKNTYTMREKLSICKREIERFYRLKEDVLHHYFWN